MTRTFSKIHGLANLRIGWAYAPAAIVGALNRVRPPFNINGAALAAGVAAIADGAHVDAAAAHNARWLPWLEQGDFGAGDRRDAERRQLPVVALSPRDRPRPPPTPTGS